MMSLRSSEVEQTLPPSPLEFSMLQWQFYVTAVLQVGAVPNLHLLRCGGSCCTRCYRAQAPPPSLPQNRQKGLLLLSIRSTSMAASMRSRSACFSPATVPWRSVYVCC